MIDYYWSYGLPCLKKKLAAKMFSNQASKVSIPTNWNLKTPNLIIFCQSGLYFLLKKNVKWLNIGATVAKWRACQTHNPRVVGSTPVQLTRCILGKGTWFLFPCLPRGALNRGAVCVRMHSRLCTDVKEPGWPSENLGVQKQTDHACMQKTPRRWNVAAYGRAYWKRSHTYFLRVRHR